MENIWSIHENILKELEGMEKKIREKSGEQMEDQNATSHNRGLLMATLIIKQELTRVFTAFRDQDKPTEEDEENKEELRNVNPRDERMMDKLKQ